MRKRKISLEDQLVLVNNAISRYEQKATDRLKDAIELSKDGIILHQQYFGNDYSNLIARRDRLLIDLNML